MSQADSGDARRLPHSPQSPTFRQLTDSSALFQPTYRRSSSPWRSPATQRLGGTDKGALMPVSPVLHSRHPPSAAAAATTAAQSVSAASSPTTAHHPTALETTAPASAPASPAHQSTAAPPDRGDDSDIDEDEIAAMILEHNADRDRSGVKEYNAADVEDDNYDDEPFDTHSLGSPSTEYHSIIDDGASISASRASTNDGKEPHWRNWWGQGHQMPAEHDMYNQPFSEPLFGHGDGGDGDDDGDDDASYNKHEDEEEEEEEGGDIYGYNDEDGDGDDEVDGNLVRNKMAGKKPAAIRSDATAAVEMTQSTEWQQPQYQNQLTNNPDQYYRSVQGGDFIRRDSAFAAIYILNMIAFVISGIVLCFTTDSHVFGPGVGSTLYAALKDSIGLLFAIALATILLGVVWFSVLRRFVREILWIMVIAVPFVSLATFSWSLGNTLMPPPEADKDKAYRLRHLLLCATSAMMGAWHSLYAFRQRHEIQESIASVAIACKVLGSNPELFGLAFALLAGYVAFIATWLIFVSRLPLLGYFVIRDPSLPNIPPDDREWKLSSSMYALTVWYVCTFFWTTGVFSNVLRMTIALVTSQWYFYRHDPASAHLADVYYVRAAFVKATSTLFGSVCAGGIILSACQTISYGIYLWRRILRQLFPKARPLPVAATIAVLRGVEKWLELWNDYAIIYVALTGHGFFSSAYSAAAMLRRHSLHRAQTVWIVQVILNAISTCIAMLLGYATSVYSQTALGSSYPYLSGLLGSLVPYFVLQFFAHILVSTIESVIVCLAIDRETNTDHLGTDPSEVVGTKSSKRSAYPRQNTHNIV
ncbi:hypothetical protein GQ42DRAFT_160538 [Ramicandelaber brevisporus]|nr:hypothetical protein GQ42DRAFT_160538 [Ramicandelaber brevisporus]